MNEKPYITICGTTYQTAKTLDASLSSVVNVFNESGVSYEVVIVDNYSTDGTYEKLLEWSRKIPLRIYRYKCSRGLGRALCIRLARGKYIFMMDFDRVYNGNSLKKIVKCHLIVSEKLGIECTRLCDKDIVLKINYRDLNRAEDVDRYVRFIINGVKFLPITTEEPLYVETRTYHVNATALFIRTLPTELRYVKGVTNYFIRALRNALDTLTGGAYTFTKFVREDYYVWSRDLSTLMRIISITLRIIIVTLLLIINKLRGIPTYEASKLLSNHLFVNLHWALITMVSKKLLNGICWDNYDYRNDVINIIKDPVFRYAWTMYSYERKIHSN